VSKEEINELWKTIDRINFDGIIKINRNIK
jgi:hypothetical protein